MKKRILSSILALVVLMSTFAFASAEVSKEDYTIQYLSTYVAAFDMNEDYVARNLEEVSGFKVSYDMLPSENTDQALMMEVSTGTDYDVLFLSTDQWNQLLDKNMLVPLEDYLEGHDNILNNIFDPGWSYVTRDGHIYGIPQGSRPTNYNGMLYRKDLFDQYGWTFPTTLDEFYNLLVDIKEKTGMIPLTGKGWYNETITSAFGLGHEFELQEDGTVQSYLRKTEAMKGYLEFMAKLYKEGLIDIDWPVNTSSAVAEKMTSGQAVMTYTSAMNGGSWTQSMKEIDPESTVEFGLSIPLSDGNGNTIVNGKYGMNYVACVVKGNEDTIDLVLDMIDWRLEDDNFRLMYNGYEGTHWEYNAEGAPTPIQPAFGTDLMYSDKFCIGFHETIQPVAWLARVQKTEGNWELFLELNLGILDCGLNADPLAFASFPDLSEYNASLKTLISDFGLQAIAGTASIDEYDAFVNRWEEAGGLLLEKGYSEWASANADLVKDCASATSPYEELFQSLKEAA